MDISYYAITKEELKEAYKYLASFYNQDNFQDLMNDLFSLDEQGRFTFVKEVILDERKLNERGIYPPNDILIQRSYFYDNRPTLFCLTKYLSDKKRKVTITIDSDSFKGRE